MTDKPRYKYNYVLLIDDVELDNFINESLMAIRFFSKRIDAFTSAKEALEMLKDPSRAMYPDVIFVDVNMPVMDGFEFIELLDLQKHITGNPPKLVMLTSSLYNDDRERALHLPGDIIYVHKPLTDEMLDRI